MSESVGGEWFRDGRLHIGVGIEDTFIPQERIGQRKLDEYELTQHYHLWREDLELAAASGADFIRWGIPWYLVEPREGEFDFGWVDDVAARLRELGLRPVIDLMHYGTPLWMENAFLDPRYPEAVARYARAVAERYIGVFDDFTPLNEPLINAVWCGKDGRWPPYLHGDAGFVSVLMPVVLGMVRTQAEIAAVNPGARFVSVDAGFAWAGDYFPELSRDELNEWRFLALDLVLGRVDSAHPMWDYLVRNGARREDLELLRGQCSAPDVLGINYYPAFTTQTFVPGGGMVPFEAGVAGLEELVAAYHERYGLPMAITETSRSTHEVQEKIEWIDQSLALVDRMRADGVPIVGYTWFPMLDLYDWAYRDTVRPADDYLFPFGLVTLKRGADNVLRREPNAAFDHFAERVARYRG